MMSNDLHSIAVSLRGIDFKLFAIFLVLLIRSC